MTKQPCNPEKFEQGCAQLGITLSAEQGAQMRLHLELLMKWNRHQNLTAVKSFDDMVVRHLLDCLAIAPFVAGDSLLDVGSGGGFPGLPLAIYLPQIKVTLLDSRARRIAFLRHVCAALCLDNISVVRSRVEEYQPEEKFDTLAARAFASLADILKSTAALHQRGGRLLAMKGRMPAQEIANLDSSWRARTTFQKLRVPFLDAERHLIIIEW